MQTPRILLDKAVLAAAVMLPLTIHQLPFKQLLALQILVVEAVQVVGPIVQMEALEDLES
jgi:hypothetical protein